MSASQKKPKNTDSQKTGKIAVHEQQIIDTSSIGVLITRISDGSILYANKSIATLLGTPDVSSVIGKPVPDFYWDPEERRGILKHFQAEGSVKDRELRARRADGSMFWVSISIQPFVFEGERVLLSEIADINDRKQAEKVAREGEERFRSIYNNATIGLYRTTPEGQILMINPTGLRLLGFDTFEELAKRNLEETGFEQEDARKNFREKLEREGVIEQESIWTKKDGTPIFVRESSTVFRDENGNVLYYDGSFEDFTERKQAEAELRQNELLLSNAIGIARMGYWDLDINTQMFIFNDQYYRTFHATTTEEMGGNQMSVMDFIKRFVPPGEGNVIGSGIQEAIETKDPNFQVKLEAQNLTVQGELRWVSVWITIEKDAQGRTTTIHGVNQDITERKRLEAQVQQAFERRGYQVQVGTEISQEVASASELSELFGRVVTLTKERLGYYHTQLLRYDADRDAVVLIKGYGEIGQKMLAGGHQMPMGQGLIGTAAASGETILRPTLADDPDWQPNPLLPDTKGEIAVPIKWQDTVLGVLDVQSNQAGALSDEDRLLFEGLCGQIAIAMHNAELVETIRQNEAKLAEALKTARLANWEYDVEKDLFTFNDQFYSLFHLTAEKVGGYQISSARYAELFVHPDDVEVVGMEIGKALNSTERVYNTTIDQRFLYADGGVGHMQVNVTVERDENGKITRNYGVNQDITERKQAEEALRDNEAKLAEALLAARLANWEYDVEKDIFTFNDQFYSIFHTTAEKVGGYQISSARYAEIFVHPDDMEVVGAEIGKALSSKERVYNTTIDHRIRYEDGGVGYITVQLTVERDENGKITRYYGANQDITERKQAETALRDNEAKLAEALKIAGLANWEYDVEKDIFTFNDQFYSLFHTTAEQHGGYQLPSAYYAQHFVYPDDLPIVGVEIGQALNSTERHYSRNMEHRILYADGSVGHMQVNINVERDENGKITRYYGANQDITERTKEQEALAERLEEINRLYQAVSHEGWKSYRNTANLPAGFMYDQAGLKPVDNDFSADESFVNVPMKVLGGEVVGSLAIAEDPQNPASSEDRAFLQQVSEQIALALEGARLSAQTQSALSQSEILFESSRRLAQVSDLQELLKVAVEAFNIPAINGAELNMFSYDSEGDLESLAVVANWWNGTGKEPGAIGSRYPKAMFSAIKLFITSTPVFINDTTDNENMDASMLRIVKAFNIRAATFLPLFVGTQQIGVLVMHAEEPHNFTEEETRLFSGLAPQIATVLENRRQFERAQQQAQRESTLNVISQKIQSATTVEAVLQIAARELGHALGAPMTIAQLSMKDKK